MSIIPKETNIPTTLADVIDRLRSRSDLGKRRREGLLAGVRLVCRALGLSPAAVPADPRQLRELLKSVSAAAVGVGEASWRSGRCCCDSACEISGVPMVRKRSREPMSADWTALLATVADKYAKSRLTRLGRYCTSKDVTPSALDDATAGAFRQVLMAGGLVDRPTQVHRNACVTWNVCAATMANWPPQTLTVPDNRGVYVLPPETFTASLRAEVAACLTDRGVSDPFSDAPRQSLSPATIKTRRIQLWELLTALVLTGREPSSIVSLADLVTVEAAKAVLTFLWTRNGKRKTGQMHNFARLLVDVATHWVRMPESDLARLQDVRRQLDPGKGGMTERTKTRLRPFHDRKNVTRLVGLPAAIMRDLSGMGTAMQKEAVRAQSAVAIAIELAVPLRAKNLAGLTLDRHIIRTGSGPDAITHIVIPSGEIKNDVALEFILPSHVVALLDHYLGRFRPVLLTKPSTCLFPNERGGPKDPGSFGTQIKKTIAAELKLDLNLHAFRHLAAFLFLSANPGEYETVRLLLGHKDIATTVRFYCEFERPAAFRRYDEMLDQYRAPENRPRAA